MIEFSESEPGKLDKVDWRKIARGAVIGCVGAVLVYLAQYIAGFDFGQWTPLATVAGGVLANTGRRLMMNNNQ